MEPQLYTTYKKMIVPALMKEFGYSNRMQVPRIEKIVVNVGYGKKIKEKVFIDTIEDTLQKISGQKPVHNKAAKSISNFKIRAGMNVGASVTLRGNRMYEFLFKVINIVLPRVRDFRGLSPKAFDQKGNYCFGIKESIAFPEVRAESAEKIHGMDICIKTTAKNTDEGFALLEKMGFPFMERKEQKKGK